MKPTLLLIGLGNHGASYENTRHNAGFHAIDRLSKEFGEGDWQEARKFLAETQDGRVVTAPVLLVKPHTYMNRSGECIRKLIDFYKLDPKAQMIVFCDDIDVPLGEVRFRKRGGPGTHNGLKSIVDIFGEDFSRARIGIGPQPAKQDLAAWVLSALSAAEKKTLKEVYEKLPELVRKFVMGEYADASKKP